MNASNLLFFAVKAKCKYLPKKVNMSLKRIKLSDTTESENLTIAIEGIFDGISNYFKLQKRKKERGAFNQKVFTGNSEVFDSLKSEDTIKDTFDKLRTAVREDFLSGDLIIDRKANSRLTLGPSLNWISNLDTKVIVSPRESKAKMRELFATANSAFNQALPSIRKRQEIISDLDALKTDEDVKEYLSKIPETGRPKRGILRVAKVRGVRDVIGTYGVWFSTEWEGGAAYTAVYRREQISGLKYTPLTDKQAIAFAKEYVDYLDYIESILPKIAPMISTSYIMSLEQMWEDSDCKVVSGHGVDKWLTAVMDEENVEELDEVLFNMQILMLYSVMGYYRYLINATSKSK